MEAIGLRPPSVLSFQGNVADNWKRWKQAFTVYLTASESSKKDEKVQCALFLNLIGEEAQQIFNTFTFNSEEQNKLECLVKKFEEYCIPKRNLTHERYKFNSRVQLQLENFEKFFTDLQLLSKTCDFGQIQDSLMTDRIVCGIRDDSVRERLLREPDLDLNKAVNICKTAEQSKIQLSTLRRDEEKDVNIHRVQRDKKQASKRIVNKSNYSGDYRQPQVIPEKGNENKTKKGKGQWMNKSPLCQRCGKEHQEERRCPAMGVKCHKCGKLNHYATQCKTRTIATLDPQDEVKKEYFVGSITDEEKRHGNWYTYVRINGKSVRMKMDTGAEVSVLTMSTYEKVRRKDQNLVPSKIQLKAFGGNKIPVKGEVTLMCKNQKNFERIKFYVISDKDTESVLGGDACQTLRLIKTIRGFSGEPSKEEDREWVMNDYKDVFEGTGCIPFPYRLQVDPNVKPVQHTPRRVPLAMLPKLKQELERMVKDGIITPITEPTEWISSVTLVEKPNGSVRVCLDPRDLNKAILREHYQSKTLDEIASKVHGTVKWSVLDASSGFWQVPLEEGCRKLTTFNTPYGRYYYNRVPFGISSAPEVFNRSIQQIFEGLEGIDTYTDDILIEGTTDEEHDERLKQALGRARRNNLKLNPMKCRFGVREVQYLGHIWNKNGLVMTDDKIVAITKMQTPENKPELLRFLGMVNYLSRFLPNLSQQTVNLRNLTKKETMWVWTKSHEMEFTRVKELVTQAPVLQFFNPKEQLYLQVDASKDGLGAALLQNGHPIAYASKMMTSCQKKYAQIEKEALSIVYGCEKFHHLIYGRKVIVNTDHKPLENIQRKSLEEAPPRIQRLLLRLLKYDLEVKYLPGKEMYLADTLSRAFGEEERPRSLEEARIQQVMLDVEHDVDLYTRQKTGTLTNSLKLQDLVQATKVDQQMQMLSKTITQGWPERRYQLSNQIREFYPFRDELSVIDGLVFKGGKVVIPEGTRSSMLEALHQGHWGLERSKQRAREVMFWPGMNQHIEEIVSRCRTCLTHRNSNPKEPLLLEEITTQPWEKVATDLFEWNKEHYLLVVDYYSGYPEIHKLQDMKGETVIHSLKSIFARHGIPKELRSDNGPQYKNQEFMKFTRSWKIKHSTSSPGYSQANGLAERAVQTMKKMLTKCLRDGSDPYLGLMEYRNTPLIGEYSPAQLLMNRRLNSLLPETYELLKPRIPNPESVQTMKRRKQIQQKAYYDQHTHRLPTFTPGETAYMRRNDQWDPVTVKATADKPRSYVVETPRGTQYRRNRRHLLGEPQHKEEKEEESMEKEELEQSEHNSDLEQQPATQNQAQELKEPSDRGLIVTTRSGREIRKPMKYRD